MKRIAVLGRAASGKSTLAQQLSWITHLPVFELDDLFWGTGLTPTPPKEWQHVHAQLIGQCRWIIDGDLGVYDNQLDQRITRADTIIILDFPLRICFPRALRRSRETREFWAWLINYRRVFLPHITTAAHNSQKTVHTLQNPHQVRTFLTGLPNAS